MKNFFKFFLVTVLALSFVPVVNAQTAVPNGDVDPQGDVACLNLTTSLRYRDTDATTGGQVSQLQDFLVSQGYISGNPTGYFGLATFGAVKKFQTQYGFSPTGFVGVLTRGKIKEITCNGTIEIIDRGGATGLPRGCTSTLGYSALTGERCFTTQSASITVLSPNGGESFDSKPLNISWASIGGDTVSIYLAYPNGGVCYIGQTNSKANNYYFDPANESCLMGGDRDTPLMVSSGKYKISIFLHSKTESSGQTSFGIARDSSNSDFTLNVPTWTKPSITVLIPNGGEQITKGSSYNIRWNSSNLGNSSISIALLNSNESNVGSIVQRIPNTGSYLWTVPNTYTDGKYKIIVFNDIPSDGVVIPGVNDRGTSDKSDAYFTIIANPQTQPTITILSPNGGENFKLGEVISGSFTTNKPVGTTCDIAIIRPLNTSATVIDRTITHVVTSAQDKQTFLGIIPTDIPLDQYKIRIVCGVNSDFVQDQSDNNFSIIAPVVKLQKYTDDQILTYLEQAARNRTKSIFIPTNDTDFDMNNDRQVNATDQILIRSIKTITDDKFDVAYKRIVKILDSQISKTKTDSSYIDELDTDRDGVITAQDKANILRVVTGKRVYPPVVAMTDAEIISSLETTVRKYPCTFLTFSQGTCDLNFDFGGDNRVDLSDEITVRNVLTLGDVQFDALYKKIMAAMDARIGLKTGDAKFEAGFDVNRDGTITIEDESKVSSAIIGTRSYLHR